LSFDIGEGRNSVCLPLRPLRLCASHICVNLRHLRAVQIGLQVAPLCFLRLFAAIPVFSVVVIHCPPALYEVKPFHHSKFTIKIHQFRRKTALQSKLFSLLQTRFSLGDPKVTPSIRGFFWGQKPPFWPSFRLHRAKGSFSAHAIIARMNTEPCHRLTPMNTDKPMNTSVQICACLWPQSAIRNPQSAMTPPTFSLNFS
jgi:hypothetical protein